jgi:hypothetical protein
MGLSVAEYFAQKEACADCAEHGTEEHCVTTLLSRKENCFVYNIVDYRIGDYTLEQIQLLKDLRSVLPEELNVNYYVRSEKIIEKLEILVKPFYEQHFIYNKINYNHIRNVVSALTENKIEDAKRLINNMLDVLEEENNIQRN